jgi:hypothetical protein
MIPYANCGDGRAQTLPKVKMATAGKFIIRFPDRI